MKHLFTLCMSLVLFLSATVNAMADEICLSYCEGVISDKSTTISGTQKTIQGGICLPQSDIAKYAGLKITRIRVGVNPNCSKLPSYATAWVRTEKDGENLGSKKQAVSKGWNELTLDEPVTIPEGSDLWIGFSYPQANTKLSVFAFGGPKVEGYSFWSHNGSMAGWVDHSMDVEGALCVEAVVEGDNLPQHDLTILAATPTRSKNRLGNDVLIKGVIRNSAVVAAEGYTIAYSVNDGAATGEEVFDQTISYREKQNFEITIPTEGLEEGLATITLNLLWNDGTVDEYDPDNTITTQVALYTQGYPRTVLLEEFTTELCGWCPLGILYINQALDTYNLRDQVVWVCHHNGYGTDFLTASESSSYLQLYGTGGTFAPAMMIDRTFNANYTSDGVVGGATQSPAQTAAWINAELGDPAFCSVKILDAYIDGSQVKAVVKLEKSDNMDAVTTAPQINVWIIENHIRMRSQSDFQGVSTGYHEHAFRLSLTGVWGQSIAWDDDNTCQIEYTGNLNSSWNKENLDCVAFINRHTANNIYMREVYNADKFKVAQASGIHTVTDAPSSVSYFDLNGRPVANALHGVFIQKSVAADGSISTKKVVVE